MYKLEGSFELVAAIVGIEAGEYVCADNRIHSRFVAVEIRLSAA